MEIRTRAVPLPIIVSLIVSAALQIYWHGRLAPPSATASALPAAPSLAQARLQSFSEPLLAANLYMLRLQGFDNQSGISLPFSALPYTRVGDWLALALALDPKGQYPLMLASQLYAQVPDAARQRYMLDFTYRHFFADPQRRWRWLAHAAIMAKHRLRDLPLALRYAQAIAIYATGPNTPHWAQQMPIFILQDMGELESAKIMLGALLTSGTVRDPRELHFLSERLRQLEQELKKHPL